MTEPHDQTPRRHGIIATAWLVARNQVPLFSNRRGIVPSLLLVIAPVAIAAIVTLHSSRPPKEAFFYGMIHGYYAQFAVGVLMLGIGLAGFPSDEANGTLAYLFTKPVPRGGLLLGRVASSCAVGALLAVVSASAAGTVMQTEAHVILRTWPALVASACYYGVLFTVLPLATTRTAAVGLVYILVWEAVMSVLPGAIHTLTANYYIRALLPEASMAKTMEVPFLAFLSQRPSEAEAVVRLALTCVLWGGAGWWLLRNREYSASRNAEEGA